jgi:hypothetical protein
VHNGGPLIGGINRMALRILFCGMIAGDPFQGGATYAILQYLLGLHRLGHDVYFIEPIARESLQPPGANLGLSRNAEYFRQIVGEFGLEGHAALLLRDSHETTELSYGELKRVARSADLLLNVSGMLTDPELLSAIPTRVYLDLDPAFVQLWQATQGIDMRFDGHTHFVTIGLRIGQPDCEVPTCGRKWIPTLQPVILAHWPVAADTPDEVFTTIGNWRGYGSIEHASKFYGQKAHSLRRIIELPRYTSQRIRLALAIDARETKDLAALAANGWTIIDPVQVADTPTNYRRFIQRSKAELGIVKSGYVASRCGWFSDRSACYLASGRPVLTEDTGFSTWLPRGEGLLAFRGIEDAVAGIDAINGDYTRHARAARQIAETYFDSDRVLTRLLERIGGSS